MSTTLGYPACSRSSTVQVVLAPVTTLVTVNTVPNGSVGLAHFPGGAAEYHVACPRSLVGVTTGGAATGATLGATVVVVTGTANTLAAVCCRRGGCDGRRRRRGRGRGRRCRRTNGCRRGGPGRGRFVVHHLRGQDDAVGRHARRTRAHVRHATSRDRLRSPRVRRVPIRAAARGEALRTRHHRGLRRRRGASPECSVSAGLHPSPGTVHPRRHQVGGGDGAEHRYSTGACANEKAGTTQSKFHFPRSEHNSRVAFP